MREVSEPKEGIPRLNQCYLCKAWHLEKDLLPIEIQDQAGYIRKLSCKKCLNPILGEKGE
jgi:hypothetical protein